MKKTISLILSVLMILSSFSIITTISAKETNVISTGADNSGTTGDCTWTFDESTGTLTISGQGKMDNYEYDHDFFGVYSKYRTPWDGFSYEIKKVIIKNGVTDIGNDAFYDCYNLTNITIPNSVKSIGDSALRKCTSLKNIIIPDSVVSIGDFAFYECTNLADITIPNNITSINFFTFSCCENLESVSMSDSVTTICKNAFSQCSKLKKIKWSKNLVSIEECAFSNCKSLMIINLPDGVTTIDSGTFHLCTNLKSVVLPDSVSSIDAYVFDGCENLTDVKLPNGITSIENGLFEYCHKLSNIIIPNSVKTIGIGAFEECWGLTSVIIPQNVTTISSYAFSKCNNLTSVTIPKSVTKIGMDAFDDFKNVKDIYYDGTKRQLFNVVGSDYWNVYNINVHCSIRTDSDTMDNCKWSFDEKTGILIIEGTGVVSGTPWEAYSYDIKEVDLKKGITHIDWTEFLFYPYLSNIYFNGTKKQLEAISDISGLELSNVDVHCKDDIIDINKLSLDKYNTTLLNGKSITVKAKVSPTNATNKKLKWTTSNSKVAVVNSRGKITAKGRGTATIKVMALDGSKKYATVKVTVKQPVTSVKLNRNSANLKVKGKAKQKTVTLRATAYPKNANNKAVSWKSSNSKIATVNSKGKVTAKKRGTCYIYATAKDGSKKSAKCKIVVK